MTWLFEDDISILKQKIHFKDRYEYRIGGVKHNPTGAAVIYHDGVTKPEYWMNGDQLSDEEWAIQERLIKLEKIFT